MDSRVQDLHRAVDDIRDRIKAAAEDMKSDEATAELQKAVTIAVAELSDLQTTLEQTTRKKPMLALGGALAVGYMLGKLFSSK